VVGVTSAVGRGCCGFFCRHVSAPDYSEDPARTNRAERAQHASSRHARGEGAGNRVKTFGIHNHVLHPMRRRARAPRPAEHSTQAGSARSAIAAQAISNVCAPDGSLSEASAVYTAIAIWMGPSA
jgi:hypothetical protein